jgi:hypothetical protein
VLNEFTPKDMAKMITANTATMSRFGPSGSLISQKNNLEHAIAVIPEMSNEVFFDLKSMEVIILEI